MLSPRTALTLVFLGAAAVLTAALFAQYAAHLAPCELCLYERWPYYAALPLALALAGAHATPGDRQLGAVVLALVFAASLALAAYHVGVERHWFEGPTACTQSGAAPKTIEELRKLLANQQPVRCDIPQWSFHGITLAGLNALASAALLALSVQAIGRRR
jgi:disulfide bond formation protein DsbB